MATLEKNREDKELAPESEDSRRRKEKDEQFSEVRRKRKRKLRSDEMEVEEEGGAGTTAKRPSFPPVEASLASVRMTVT